MTSSLQKFIIKNNGLVCDSEVRITLAKAEKMEETNQIKMTESFKRKCFQKTESKSLGKYFILFILISI